MSDLRYVIEGSDNYGWFDHSFHSSKVEAIREAEYLRESFEKLRVVDRENQATVWEYNAALNTK